jgi:hypothetical protein
MDNQLQWVQITNREHIEQLMHDADTHRQLCKAAISWRHQLAQTLQAWARKLEPEIEQAQHKLA